MSIGGGWGSALAGLSGLGAAAQQYQENDIRQKYLQNSQMDTQLRQLLQKFQLQAAQRKMGAEGAAGGYLADNLAGLAPLGGASSPTQAQAPAQPATPRAIPGQTSFAMPSGGASNPEITTNNFAGMRQPGVPAAGGPRTNPAGWQQFPTPEAGIAAISKQLDRYAAGGVVTETNPTGAPLTTVRQIVTTWAPPNENNTEALVARAAQVMGVQPDQALNLGDPAVKGKLVEAMIRGEQGGQLPIDPTLIGRVVGGGAQGVPGPMAQGAPAQGAPAQGAPAQAGQPAAPGVGQPPPAYDPAAVAAAIKRQHPELDGAGLAEAVAIVGKQLGPQYKAQFDRWAAMADIGLKQSGQTETGRHNRATEVTAAAGQTETGRHQRVVEAETHAQHEWQREFAQAKLQGTQDKLQRKADESVMQMDTLADQARQLYAMVEGRPDLVGAKGGLWRTIGSVKEQVLGTPEDPAIAEFKSRIELLKARLAKPLLGARYFSGRSQEQISKVLPGLDRLDNPSLVMSSLRNIAEALETTAAATRGAAKEVGADYSKMTDQQLLEGLGIGATAQPGQQ